MMIRCPLPMEITFASLDTCAGAEGLVVVSDVVRTSATAGAMLERIETADWAANIAA